MKSAVENLTPTRVKLDVEVSFEELKPSIAEAYKTIGAQVQVPGFRKGKVPTKLIDQRVGRGYVLETAINSGLNGWYQEAVIENKLTPLSRPEVEITEVPDPSATEGVVKFQVELDIRPEIELPDYEGLAVEVAALEASEEDTEKALDELRARFGTLTVQDRPAADGDFLTINIAAKIDDVEVDSASDLSYQIGAGNMLDGLDEAATGLSAGEEAIFNTKLAGGEHAGEEAQVTVQVTSVKVRELPEANDDFAQLASEFDTIAELKEDLAKQANESKIVEQGVEARDKVLEKLVALVEVPVPDSVVAEQLEQHFKAENAHGPEEHDTEEHRAEVKDNTEKAFRNEIILDAIAEKEEVSVSQAELIDYIVSSASQYGMEPNQFAQMLDSSGQVNMIVGEVRRRKALAAVLGKAVVTDSEGATVDLTDFVSVASEDEVVSDDEITPENEVTSDDEAIEPTAVSDPGEARV